MILPLIVTSGKNINCLLFSAVITICQTFLNNSFLNYKRKMKRPQVPFHVWHYQWYCNITEYEAAQQHDAERQTVAKAVCAADQYFEKRC